MILLLRGSVSLQINGVEVDFRYDSIGLVVESWVLMDSVGRNALADVLDFF